jgi:hypothetical protein
MKNLGITLLIAGIIMTVFTGFNIITKKKVVDLGALYSVVPVPEKK